MIHNTLFVTQSTLFVNQVTQDTLRWEKIKRNVEPRSLGNLFHLVVISSWNGRLPNLNNTSECNGAVWLNWWHLVRRWLMLSSVLSINAAADLYIIGAVCGSRKMITSSWESPVTTWTPHNHPVQLQVSFDGLGWFFKVFSWFFMVFGWFQCFFKVVSR